MSIIACRSIAQNPAMPCPPELLEKIVAVRVPFIDFGGIRRSGIVEIHRKLVPDIEALFDFMAATKFPLSSVRPVAEFRWSDTLSMLRNNTSAFNHRTYVSKTDGKIRLSKHAFGFAIDINPLLNPDIKDGIAEPHGSTYDPRRPGALHSSSRVVRFAERLGWSWGGRWKEHQDVMHFEKLAP